MPIYIHHGLHVASYQIYLTFCEEHYIKSQILDLKLTNNG